MFVPSISVDRGAHAVVGRPRRRTRRGRLADRSGLGDSGYNRFAAAWGGSDTFGSGNSDPLAQILTADRPIHDRKLADLVGIDRILFGSDWPHGEGLAEPMNFMQELSDFSEPEVRKIMRDNCLELLGPAR